MKYSGIAGLLAVVTAVTGAAIPKRDLENTAEADIAKLEKDLAVVKQALAEKKEEKRDGLNSLVGEVTEPVQSLTGGLLKRQVGQTLDGATKPLEAVPAVGPTVHSVVNGAGQLVDSITGELLKRQVGQTLDGATKPLEAVPAVGPTVHSVVNEAGQLVDGITGQLLKRQVGQTLDGATKPLEAVPAVGPVVHSVVNEAGQLVDGLTGQILKRDGLTELTQDLPVVNDILKRQVGQTLDGATKPLEAVPAVGPVVHSVVNEAGQLVDGLTGQLLKRDGLTDLTQELPVVNDILKRQVGNLLDTVEAPVKGLNLPVVTPAVDGLGNTLNSVTSGLLKREDQISQLAGSLLPQLTNLGVLPQNFSLTQLTSLLNVLNAKGLVGNLEQVLGSLLGGGLLKNVEGLLPVKRDNEISQLANGILPELQGVLPQGFGVEQLTGLLNVLNVNGLLANVESVLGSLL